MSESNKRQYPRADIVFQLAYHIKSESSAEAQTNGSANKDEGKDEKEQGSAETQSRDLSGGGVSFVITSPSIGKNFILGVQFTIEGLPGEISASCKVIRVWNENGTKCAAAEFIEIDSSDHEIILDFIEAQLLI